MLNNKSLRNSHNFLIINNYAIYYFEFIKKLQWQPFMTKRHKNLIFHVNNNIMKLTSNKYFLQIN